MNALQRRHFLTALAAAGGGSLVGAAWAASHSKVKPGADAALIVVDVQNCFVTGGTLPVKDGPVLYLCTGKACQPPTSDELQVKESLR